MTFLRRALLAFAVVWAACGLAVAVAPRWILVSWFSQVPYPDYTYVRICGVAAIGMAMLAVLVSRRLEELWWWSWAFAFTSVLVTVITGLHALTRPPAGSGVLLWWMFAGVNAVLGGALMVGMGRAGQEKPFA
jgi:hypothetical protein